MKHFLVFFTFIIALNTQAQDAFYYSKINSDKWFDGYEWGIVEKNDIKMKVLCQGINSNQIVFMVEIQNNSKEDFNIDPNEIFYTSDSFNPKVLNDIYAVSTFEGSSTPSASIAKHKERLKTVRCHDQYKLVRENKTLSTLGFLFTPDAVALNRTYEKADYYRANAFLKNTIEPGTVYAKLLFMDFYEEIDELTLYLFVNGQSFAFPFSTSENQENN